MTLPSADVHVDDKQYIMSQADRNNISLTFHKFRFHPLAFPGWKLVKLIPLRKSPIISGNDWAIYLHVQPFIFNVPPRRNNIFTANHHSMSSSKTPETINDYFEISYAKGITYIRYFIIVALWRRFPSFLHGSNWFNWTSFSLIN